MSLNRAAVSVASLLLGLSAASAQSNKPAPGCTLGTVNCPTYTAPATTAVPRAPMDGSMYVPFGTSTPLFNGAVPPNGFMVQTGSIQCFVNDNGTAAIDAGFFFGPNGQETVVLYVTPQGYKPMGSVNVFCPGSGGGSVYVAARGW
jgi:hypothetical protein